jgi:hypothetical protein
VILVSARLARVSLNLSQGGTTHPRCKARVRREQVAAWIGGIEREVVLGKGAMAAPTQACGSLRDWRRHTARRRGHFVA